MDENGDIGTVLALEVISGTQPSNPFFKIFVITDGSVSEVPATLQEGRSAVLLFLSTSRHGRPLLCVLFSAAGGSVSEEKISNDMDDASPRFGKKSSR